MSIGGEQRFVRVEQVPVRGFLESQDHQHDLVRELQLIEIGDRFDTATAEVSHQLARLIADILQQYDAVRSSTREQMLAALKRGEEVATLEVPVYPGMGAALRRWLDLLEQANRLCHEGELLLVASSDEMQALRRWYAEEITAQLDDDIG